MLTLAILAIVISSLCIQNSTSMRLEQPEGVFPLNLSRTFHISQWSQINLLTNDFIEGDADNALIGIDFDKVLAREDSVTENPEIPGECNLADPDIPQILTEWRAKGYKAIIVTALLNLFAPWRARQKQHLGIDFISAIQKRGSLRNDSTYRIDIDNGIIYSVYIANGPGLCWHYSGKKYRLKKPTTFDENIQILEKYKNTSTHGMLTRMRTIYAIKYPEEILMIQPKGNAITGAIKDGFLDKPQKLVFIDDDIDNIHEIATMCERQNIQGLLLHYEYEQTES
ncbi:MAG: DUF2608 domain-containing protein [Holosporaceae bacterium]|nr:DUF2608 domain-containing protein [Holosporaceae bacterium]